MKNPFDRKAENLGNITGLEHVNVEIPNQGLASDFYLLGCGLTRDPYMFPGTNNMWVNVGKSQFHLPTGDAAGVARPCRHREPRPRGAVDRLQGVKKKLEGHQVQVQGAQRLRRGDLPVGQQVPPLRAGRGALRQDQSRHALCRVHRAGRDRRRASPASTRRSSAPTPRSRTMAAARRRTSRSAPSRN